MSENLIERYKNGFNPVLGKTWKLSTEARENHRKSAKKGAESPFWKGGITSMNKMIRRSLEYKLWREAVFKRDNWTCIFCGSRGRKQVMELHPDHIKPFAYFPELRFDINNGRTLCINCHRKTPTYGVKTTCSRP